MAQSPLIILRRIYFDLTQDFCAAKLIEYFKHWREWKIKAHRSEWVYMPLRKIHEDLMCEHSVNIIKRAINKLVEWKILDRQHNPGNGQDRTWQYRLNFDVLQEKLSDHGEVNSDVPTIRSDQCLTQIPSKDIKATTTTANATNATDTTQAAVAFLKKLNIEIEIEPEPQPVEPAVPLVPIQEILPDALPRELTEEITALVESKSSGLDNLSAEKLRIVKEAGFSLNPRFQFFLLKKQTLMEDVLAAIAHYEKTVLELGERTNPIGWLIKCIKERWWLVDPVVTQKVEVVAKEHPQPSPEQIMQLRWAKSDRKIKDYAEAPHDDGRTWMVDTGKADPGVVPWWVYLEQ